LFLLEGENLRNILLQRICQSTKIITVATFCGSGQHRIIIQLNLGIHNRISGNLRINRYKYQIERTTVYIRICKHYNYSVFRFAVRVFASRKVTLLTVGLTINKSVPISSYAYVSLPDCAEVIVGEFHILRRFCIR
jgi:hypothetical protein